MEQLHVATLNIRNLADRWSERLGLLLADMSALQPDVVGLQEVVYPMQQDRGAVHVVSARLVFDRRAADDRTLFPSDHLGLSAHLEIGSPDGPTDP